MIDDTVYYVCRHLKWDFFRKNRFGSSPSLYSSERVAKSCNPKDQEPIWEVIPVVLVRADDYLKRRPKVHHDHEDIT